jgi:hypothetical protein
MNQGRAFCDSLVDIENSRQMSYLTLIAETAFRATSSFTAATAATGSPI